MLVRAALGEDPVEPSLLAPSDVVAFITSLRGRFSPASMQTVRSTLRSLFRFLRFQGFCGHELVQLTRRVAARYAAHSSISRRRRSNRSERA